MACFPAWPRPRLGGQPKQECISRLTLTGRSLYVHTTVKRPIIPTLTVAQTLNCSLHCRWKYVMLLNGTRAYRYAIEVVTITFWKKIARSNGRQLRCDAGQRSDVGRAFGKSCNLKKRAKGCVDMGTAITALQYCNAPSLDIPLFL